MGRGNVQKLEADAEQIVERLLAGTDTFGAIRKQYRVGWTALNRLWRRHTTAAQRRKVRRRTLRRWGERTRFTKGHVTWNSGFKGIHLSPETEFKPGHIGGRAARKWRPVGTVTVRRDSRRRGPTGRPRKGRLRRWIKIRDDGPLRRRWIPLTRYIWQEARGPIPDGCFVVHADGDTMNDGLDNLLLVDRRRHLALQIERNPEQLRLCRERSAETNRRRHAMNREVKKLRGALRVSWLCRACGNELRQGRRPQRCAKCGSGTFEKIQRRMTG